MGRLVVRDSAAEEAGVRDGHVMGQFRLWPQWGSWARVVRGEARRS